MSASHLVRKRARRQARRLRKSTSRLRKAARAGRRGLVLRLDRSVPAFARWRRNRQALAEEVVLISFPKSGRTWVRHLLAEYLARSTGRPFDIRLHRTALSVAVTHGPHFDHPRAPWRRFLHRLEDRRLVVLVRDPRDVAVSWYHHNRHREHTVDCDLPEFLDSPVWGIERQSAIVLDLLDLATRHPSVHLMTYERLKEATGEEIARLLDFLVPGETDHEAVREAVEASDFDRMRRRDIESSAAGEDEDTALPALGHRGWDGNPDGLKVRRGVVGGFRTEMSDALAVDVASRPATRRLLERLAALSAAGEPAARA